MLNERVTPELWELAHRFARALPPTLPLSRYPTLFALLAAMEAHKTGPHREALRRAVTILHDVGEAQHRLVTFYELARAASREADGGRRSTVLARIALVSEQP